MKYSILFARNIPIEVIDRKIFLFKKKKRNWKNENEKKKRIFIIIKFSYRMYIFYLSKYKYTLKSHSFFFNIIKLNKNVQKLVKKNNRL